MKKMYNKPFVQVNTLIMDSIIMGVSKGTLDVKDYTDPGSGGGGGD